MPDWVDVGEFLTVRALAADDWEVLSERTVVISDEDVNITLQLFGPLSDNDNGQTAVALLASAIALLVAATMILVSFVLPRRGRP